MTNKDEFNQKAWASHEVNGSVSAPLTEEEKSLQGIRAAEAKESSGTASRKGGHVSSGLSLNIDDKAMHHLRDLGAGDIGLVQLASVHGACHRRSVASRVDIALLGNRYGIRDHKTCCNFTSVCNFSWITWRSDFKHFASLFFLPSRWVIA